MTSTPSDPNRTTMSADETATLIAALQSELVGIMAETAVKVASLEDTITELAHENAPLKRRLYRRPHRLPPG